MKLCRVLGCVVSTIKHGAYSGQPLLVVAPDSGGPTFLAIDRVGAGPGDHVLVMQEGTGVRQLLALGDAVPIRSLIVGVVDEVHAP